MANDPEKFDTFGTEEGGTDVLGHGGRGGLRVRTGLRVRGRPVLGQLVRIGLRREPARRRVRQHRLHLRLSGEIDKRRLAVFSDEAGEPMTGVSAPVDPMLNIATLL